MDVGQLLARMNPKGINYMGVPGGVPELTAEDVAAALAFVPKGLGRSLLEAVYWPDGAGCKSELLDMVAKVVMPELKRQSDRFIEADLDLQIAQSAAQWTRKNPSLLQYQIIHGAQLRLVTLKGAAWPKNTLERLPLIVNAIITEMTKPIKCETCSGRG